MKKKPGEIIEERLLRRAKGSCENCQFYELKDRELNCYFHVLDHYSNVRRWFNLRELKRKTYPDSYQCEKWITMAACLAYQPKVVGRQCLSDEAWMKLIDQHCKYLDSLHTAWGLERWIYKVKIGEIERDLVRTVKRLEKWDDIFTPPRILELALES